MPMINPDMQKLVTKTSSMYTQRHSLPAASPRTESLSPIQILLDLRWYRDVDVGINRIIALR